MPAFKKFIHIAFDSIFIDYTIEQFETIIPLSSEYIIDIPNENYEIQYIKSKENISKLVLVDYYAKISLIGRLTKDNIVILHCLNQNMIDIVNKVASNITLVWIVWGGEVNELTLLRKNLYQPQTEKILKQGNNYSLKNKLYNRYPKFHYFIYKLKTGKRHPTVEKIKAIHRINYAGIFIKQDFELFNSIYDFNLEWLWYCYYNIDDTSITKSNFLYKKENRILIGNSADPRNNHIDIFNLLKIFNLNNRNIFCPLSYGTSNLNYINKVKTIGTSLFSNQFIPLIEFLPMEEYNALLNQCSIVIMNHNVQQAVGNIISSIWNGAKVYLNNCNPFYQYLKEIGIIVYSIQSELKVENPEALVQLSYSQIVHNKTILYNELSKKSVYRRTESLINLLINEN